MLAALSVKPNSQTGHTGGLLSRPAGFPGTPLVVIKNIPALPPSEPPAEAGRNRRGGKPYRLNRMFWIQRRPHTDGPG